LRAGEGEPEEEDCADEFAAHCLEGRLVSGGDVCFADMETAEAWFSELTYDEVVAQVVGDFVQEGQAEVGVVERGVGVGGFGEGYCEAAALEGGLVFV
jgi:hypothetical protein